MYNICMSVQVTCTTNIILWQQPIIQDVVERRIEDGKLYTVRFIVKKQRIPSPFMWMVPAKHKACYVKETSVVSFDTFINNLYTTN